MQVSQDQNQQLVQTQKIAPHLIQASELLQCSAMELAQTIEQEMMENPALECLDSATETTCADCGLGGIVCAHCPYNRQPEAQADPESGSQAEDAADAQVKAEPSDDADDTWSVDLAQLTILPLPDYSDTLRAGESRAANSADERFDPLMLASSSISLSDHLLSHLRSTAREPQDYRVAEYLVNCLDERGWLQIDENEAALELGITRDELSRGIGRLQACDPAGIGGRSLQECLLLELLQLQDEGRGNPLALLIVQKYWEGFVQRRLDLIARRAGKSVADVEEAARFIQAELTPDPASLFPRALGL